jgi:Na+:H+ antiporter, NhaA family
MSRRPPLRDFLHDESAGGIVLLCATVIALLWANSPWSHAYVELWHVELIGDDLQHWVNDGAMVLFFFIVGLEIKRELVNGELRNLRDAMLPALAAAGGVVLPALVFLAIVRADGDYAQGWGIPIATDIAFAVGLLAVLGRWIPDGAKLFLLSVAIADDVIAIVVIAVFYSHELSWLWLAGAVAGLLAVVVLRRLGVAAIWPYVLVGLTVWYATKQSGVHATIAGVALALLTPAGPVKGREVLRDLEHWLHPVSAFVVVPLFALANAGVDFRGGMLGAAIGSSLAWAVGLGLLLGKTIGIGTTTLLAVRAGFGTLPAGLRGREVWGLAALAGIGFTVSLFVAGLAYDHPTLVEQAKVGIFAGSLASALLGAAILYLRHRRRETLVQ